MKRKIGEQEYFDKGVLDDATVKAEKLSWRLKPWLIPHHRRSLLTMNHCTNCRWIANTIARKRLYEMNVVISDTAEYGNYLFSYACVPLLKPFMAELQPGDLVKLFRKVR